MSKIALVTGTSSGIGLSTAVLLAKSGFTTVATVRDVNKAEALRERAQREGVSLDIRRLDVGDQASVEGCVRETLAQYGRVDVLVNNAGVGHKGTLEQITIEELQQTLDVNFFGVARVTRALLPAMRAAGSGRIITVTSMNGVVGIPFSTHTMPPSLRSRGSWKASPRSWRASGCASRSSSRASTHGVQSHAGRATRVAQDL